MSKVFWRQHIRAFTLCSLVALLGPGGCADAKQEQTKDTVDAPNYSRCTEPRPKICTHEYRPVCANLEGGAKQTYASGCVACSDASVVSYSANKCD